MALGLVKTGRLDLLCPPVSKEASLPPLDLPSRTDFTLFQSESDVLPDILSSVLGSPSSIISNFFSSKPGDSLGIDIDRTDEFFSIINPLINKSSNLQDVVTGSIHKLLAGFPNTAPNFQSRSGNPPDSAVLRSMVLLLLFPILSEPDSINAILRLTGVLGALPSDSRKIIADWLATVPASYFRTILVNIQQQLTILVARVVAQAFNVDIHNSRPLVQTMSILYDANVVASSIAAPLIEHTEFYNDAINADIDLTRDTIACIEDPSHSLFVGPGPFLLNPRSKARVLQAEARGMQRKFQQDAFMSQLFAPLMQTRPQNPYLFLKVHRDKLLHETLHRLSTIPPTELKKQLKVQFIGEQGVDEGGLRQEFFQLVTEEILDEKYGMFHYTGDNTLRWFNMTATGRESEYELTGILVGLAFFNGITVDLRFPTAVWKQLLDEPVSLPDLQDIDYDLTHGLNQLLDYPGDDVEDVFCRTWVIERDVFDTKKTFELVPGGKDIPVTSANKVEFVDAFTQFLLVHSIKDQFQPFKRGFRKLFQDLKMVSHLSLKPAELELIVCGEQEMDFKALERRTIYDGYSADSATIKAFWNLIHDLPPEQQRKFLQFVTGSSRVPVGGLKEMKFIIARTANTSQLPSSHTCFNVLVLPDYNDEATLREKFMLAIQNAEGFGLI
ncbi:hypothetical protein P9112_004669 [Eukaryota sp. TZLM1-RC]